MSPKLPSRVVPGATCVALNGPTTPNPVTGAPRAKIPGGPENCVHVTHTALEPVVTVGWSTLPLAIVPTNVNVLPPSVLIASWTAFGGRLLGSWLRYVRNRLPN